MKRRKGRPKYTSRTKILFYDGKLDQGIELIEQHFSVRFVDGSNEQFVDSSNAVYFRRFNLAYVAVSLAQIKRLQETLAGACIKFAARERHHYRIAAQKSAGTPPVQSVATWGIHAIGAGTSHLSGANVKIAILDTGFDTAHQDFLSRAVTTATFIENSDPGDYVGHGTHCIGIACGPLVPKSGPRYGVAYEAQIFSGKILDNAGKGSDSILVKGIDWALSKGCRIISVSADETFDPKHPLADMESIAERALAQGAVIISSAGNDSSRPDKIAPVAYPANCPSVMAVAAVDVNMAVASFSNAGQSGAGGEVNIAAPGVDIYSSWLSITSLSNLTTVRMEQASPLHLLRVLLRSYARQPVPPVKLFGTRSCKRIRHCLAK